jgi:hypothetical protein
MVPCCVDRGRKCIPALPPPWPISILWKPNYWRTTFPRQDTRNSRADTGWKLHVAPPNDRRISRRSPMYKKESKHSKVSRTRRGAQNGNLHCNWSWGPLS